MNYQLSIQPENTLAEIQLQFHALYPHLKLEFFAKTHEAEKGSNFKFLLLDKAATIRSHAAIDQIVLLDVAPYLTAWQLEQNFQTALNIGVQVFYKKNDVWFVTTLSDKLTLKELNEKEASSQIPTALDLDALPDYKEID